MTQGERNNPIYFERRPYKADDIEDKGQDQSGAISEGRAMEELKEILSDIRNSIGIYDISPRQMLEKITFIGQREYEEAVSGIASQWKTWLDQDEDYQICPLVGVITRSGNPKNKSECHKVKSDEYMLERILSNFSDEELRQYSGRLVLDADDIYRWSSGREAHFVD